MKNLHLAILLFIMILLLPALAGAFEGNVYDTRSKMPLHDVLVTLGDQVVRTDTDGRFQLDGTGTTIKLRTPGYRRKTVPIEQLTIPSAEISLTPFTIRGLYLSVYGIGSTKLREMALTTLQQNSMNALVIDVKGDRGLIPFKTDYSMAIEIGAHRVTTIRDIKTLIAGLKKDDIYLIARIVVFKDNLLAKARPDLAVKTATGKPYTDREYLQWVDPFNPKVWEYNIDIAKIAAEAGFDEIQFDYVRFPDKEGLIFSEPANETSRTAAITCFLQAANQALTPYNVMLAADVFGYVLWNSNDTSIGQKLTPILENVDIVSPMLYPSGFQFGIPNYKNPVTHPYEIVYHSLKRAQERTNVSPLRFRPWLQAFRDYAFSGGNFGDERIRAQIRAAETFGSSGWMLWNPRNIYPKLRILDHQQSELK